jgi:PE-PPE domain/PE family
MTSLITQPQIMATAAADASAIGSAINEAKAAAAGPTTSLAAAAQDEVSAIAARFFGAYGEEYQALLQRAAAYHGQFVAALAGAGNAYAQAEAEIAGTLGLTGTAAPAFTAVTQAADPTVDAILIMSGSGFAIPPPDFMNQAYSLYMSNFNTLPTNVLTAVVTAEGLYPIFGVKDLTLDISLARGVTTLDNAITSVLGPAPSAKVVSVFGVSQSAIIASMEMPKLLAEGYNSSNAFFTLVGDPSNPNGGLLSRFPGVSIPSLGITFGTSTPSNDFPTTVWTAEYDGFADFPRYPIDFLADLNALLGIAYVHGSYLFLTPSQLASATLLPGSHAIDPANGLTDYYMMRTENLPLLEPLRAVPVVGNPLADLMQPDLKALVNWGYGDPNFGYSTSPANLPTPFGFLPPLSATTALGPLLVSGTQQGIGAFVNDLSTVLPSVASSSGSALTALTLPTSASIPTTISGVIQGIESANTNIVGTLTTDFSTAYGTLLPTADIATALVVTLPSYDANLFLNGIIEAIDGNPVQGLMDAFGNPIAASVGLTTLAGGFEFLTLQKALTTILTGAPNPAPI